MSKLMIVTVLASLILPVSHAVATEHQAAQEMDNTNVVTVTGPKYRVGPDEFLTIGGTYLLDNGATLKFSRKQNRFYVDLTGLPKTEVFAMAENRFVAKSDSMRLAFQPHESGFETKLTVRYVINETLGMTDESIQRVIVASN
jgi:hypothetical protein